MLKIWSLLAFFLLVNLTQAKTHTFEGVGLYSDSAAHSKLKYGSGDRSLRLSMSIKEFSEKDVSLFPMRESFQSLKFSEFELFQKPGSAAVPYKSLLVVGKPSELRFKVKKGKGHLFTAIKAAPAPEKPCRCLKDLNSENRFFIDELSYYANKSDVLKVDYLGDYRGIPISKITLKPAIQTREGLMVYEGLEVVVSGKRSIRVDESLFSNKSAKGSFLVITASKLKSSAGEFVEYKRSLGHSVDFFVYEEVATSAETLKAFIAKKYREKGYRYATLIGHEGILPALRVSTSNDPNTPSDYPYFAFGGAGDSLPDVHYGRFVADSNKEVRGQVFKIKEHQLKTWKDKSGTKRSIGIASNEGWDPTDVDYIREMLSPLRSAFAWSEDFFFQDDAKSTARNINKGLNRGARWFNYIGHGSGTSWSSINRDEYSSDNTRDLKSGIVKPVIIDVACQNGRFTYEGKLGERFMNADDQGRPAGAVAYFGGSVDISWDPPAVMARSIGQELAKARGIELYEVILKGQLHLLQNYGDIEAAKENLIWYHLFGDPSLLVGENR